MQTRRRVSRLNRDETGTPQGLQEVTQVVAEEVKGWVPGIMQGILQRGGGLIMYEHADQQQLFSS